MFLHVSVILSTGGGLPGQVHPPWAGRPPSRYRPGRYTPPKQVHPRQVPPSRAGTPHSLPATVHAGIRSTSGHPTGMHSCYHLRWLHFVMLCNATELVITKRKNASLFKSHTWFPPESGMQPTFANQSLPWPPAFELQVT